MIRTEKKERLNKENRSRSYSSEERSRKRVGGRSATGQGAVGPGGAQEARGGGAATGWDRSTGTLHNCRYMYKV